MLNILHSAKTLHFKVLERLPYSIIMLRIMILGWLINQNDKISCKETGIIGKIMWSSWVVSRFLSKEVYYRLPHSIGSNPFFQKYSPE